MDLAGRLPYFAAGDYGLAALIDGERRAVVRQRLQAAARRRGLALRFRSGPGPLTFHVTPALAISAPPPHEIVAATLSIVARECTVNVGNAAHNVSGNAAQLPSSALMHNARLAPRYATYAPVRCLPPPFRAAGTPLHAAAGQ